METATMANHEVTEEAKPAYEVVHSKSQLFYPEYERKSDLKHQTHYCRDAATVSPTNSSPKRSKT